MGIKRSLQTLLKVNQKDGFDCPSCAWPDPDGHRKMAEFCENGAKAVAVRSDRQTLDARDLRQPSDLRNAQAARRLAGRAGPHHASDDSPQRLRPLRADLVGRRLRTDRTRAALARLSRRGGLLHLGPRQQRGGLPVRPLRPAVRHQQSARLLEHVPRIERGRPERDRSASARRACGSRISSMPTRSSSSARIPARIIRGC